MLLACTEIESSGLSPRHPLDAHQVEDFPLIGSTDESPATLSRRRWTTTVACSALIAQAPN
jgi:hypothetical protein